MFASGPPGTPTDITMEDSTMDTLTISWSNSQNMGVVLGYQVISRIIFSNLGLVFLGRDDAVSTFYSKNILKSRKFWLGQRERLNNLFSNYNFITA